MAGPGVSDTKVDKKGASAAKVVMFVSCKKEKFTPKQGYRKCFRKLRSMGYKTVDNKEQFCKELVKDASVLILGASQEAFTPDELKCLEDYLEEGGNVLILSHEGGPKASQMNKFLKRYGIYVNSDAVVRTVYYKYLHPKEVFISKGVLANELIQAAWKVTAGSKAKGLGGRALEAAKKYGPGDKAKELKFVYPYGASLNVQEPAVPVLSSGFISYPMNRPIAAVAPSKSGKGRLCVLGSASMFSDEWLMKEHNYKVLEALLQWLVDHSMTLDTRKSDKSGDAEISEYRHLPNTEALAERLRPCLEENEPLPKDFTQLFDHKLFQFDTKLIPEAVKLYEQLHLKQETLSLIPPQFECPLPRLEPAVFPPSLREPPPPALDQFDLDEHFASERLRLAHLTNKCTSDNDLEYYIKECGEILNITPKLAAEANSPKHILEYVLKQLINFKKLDQTQGLDHNHTMGAMAMPAGNGMGGGMGQPQHLMGSHVLADSTESTK